MESKLVFGDCIEKLKELDDCSVEAIITDPPYELGFMNKKWDSTGIAYNVDMWKECLRVLKPGGHLLSFGGTRTYHRMACAIEDAGFEIRDQLNWIYASGFPKSLNIGKAYDKMMGNEREVIGISPNDRPNSQVASGMGFDRALDNGQEHKTLNTTKGNSPYEGLGTALKPSHESICLARKPLDNRSDICYIIDIIGGIKLWLLKSFVKIVEKNLVLNHQEQKEVADIAQWLAEKSINTQEDLSEVMDMLPSKLMETLNLSTVLSWLNILAEVWKAQSMSTISMELNLTTELKILHSMELESILQNITQAKDNKTNGLSADACNAVSLFNAVNLKLKHTLIHSVGVPVISKEVINSQGEVGKIPAHEPIILARKPLSEKTIVENVIKYGTGGLDIDKCRLPISKPIIRNLAYSDTEEYDKEKLTEWNIQKYKKEDYINTEGRFPANILVTDNALGDNSVYFDIDAWNDKNGLLQFSKAGKKEKNNGCENLNNIKYTAGNYSQSPICKTCNKTLNGTNDHSNCSGEVYYREMSSKNTGNHHPTIKPLALMKYLVMLVSREGQTVLDPFMGSGTTGIACKLLNRNFIGIELNEEYIKIAEARINYY